MIRLHQNLFLERIAEIGANVIKVPIITKNTTEWCVSIIDGNNNNNNKGDVFVAGVTYENVIFRHVCDEKTMGSHGYFLNE